MRPKNSSVKQAVVLAGGQGLRLRPLTLKNPKPMIRFYGKPFLEYIIDMLIKNDIKEVVLLVGYLHEKIERYFGDGKKFGIKISYSYSPVDSDTGTRLKNASKMLDNAFLLLYSDNYWPLNLKALTEFYGKLGKKALVTVYSNKDNYTVNNILVDLSGTVKVYDRPRHDRYLNGVDIGFFIINKKVLSLLPQTNCSFEDTVLPALIKQRQLGGFLTDHRYYGLSNLQRLPEIKEFLKPKKVIFLDRDGIINFKAPKASYITKWKDFIFLPGIKESLSKLNKNGYDLYIITNQPGIARKLMTKTDLDDIHRHMVKKLKKSGVRIKQIYTCTHGWNDGCDCRKPKPGLLLQAALENKINLVDSYFIGDDERDVQAGKNAGCKTVFIGEWASEKHYNLDFEPDIIARSLTQVIKKILKGNL